MTKRRAVFLDRDGVLNAAIVREGRPFSPDTMAEMTVLPGVKQACERLREAGFLLIVITNQPDIARKRISADTVNEMNAALNEQLGLDDVYVCPHDNADGCDCRKPKPGLILTAAARWNIDLPASFMIGDRARDVEAGKAAGCRTVFVDYGYDEPRPELPDMVTTSLAAVTKAITSASGGNR